MNDISTKERLPRRYSADDIMEIITLFDGDPEIDPIRLAGMKELAGILKHYENMTEEEIGQEVKRYWKSAKGA